MGGAERTRKRITLTRTETSFGPPVALIGVGPSVVPDGGGDGAPATGSLERADGRLEPSPSTLSPHSVSSSPAARGSAGGGAPGAPGVPRGSRSCTREKRSSTMCASVLSAVERSNPDARSWHETR